MKNKLFMLVVLGVMAYMLYSSNQKANAAETGGTSDGNGGSNANAQGGSASSNSTGVYQRMVEVAEQLKKGWGTFDLITREKDIYVAFSKVRSDAELTVLKEIFGTPKGHNLDVWVSHCHQKKEVAQINEILASNGIKYRFKK